MQIINKNEPNPRPSIENTMKAKNYSEALGWVNCLKTLANGHLFYQKI